MKSVHFTFLKALILAGLGLGLAGFAFAGEAPAAQPSRGIAMSALSLAASGFWSALTNHPGKTSLAIAGLYLYSNRKNSRNCTVEIELAKAETRALDATASDPGTNREQLRKWNLKPGSAYDIARFWNGYYKELRHSFPSDTKKEFIKEMKAKIQQEKDILETKVKGLDKCFEHSTFLPMALRDYNPIFDNPVQNIIKQYKVEQNLVEQNCNNFYDLNIDQINHLDKKFKRMASFSLSSLFNTQFWKTFNWHRLVALPYEADAIEQYWKLHQMLAHLDALRLCINKAENDNSLA